MKFSIHIIPVLFLLSLLSSFFTPEPVIATPGKVSICTPVWKLYTERDGQGLYHELFRRIFADASYKLKITYAPFKRCVLYLDRGRMDVSPAFYKSAKKLYVYSERFLSIDQISVVYSKYSGLDWKGRNSLRNKRVGWMRGFDFDSFKVIRVPIRVVEFDRLEYGLQKMMRKRIDYILDYEDDIRAAVKSLKYEKKLHIRYNMLRGPKTYMAFANTSRGKRFKLLWDKGFERLYRSGKLRRLYRRFNNSSY